MNWRALVSQRLATFSTEIRQDRLEEVANENDHAERLGFECVLDDRRPLGCCYFTKDNVRVWQSPDGWCRAECQHIMGQYDSDCYLYHTQTQALSDRDPHAFFTPAGKRYSVKRVPS